MLELALTRVSVVDCASDAASLDALAASTHMLVLRIAPDEALVVGPPGDADALVDEMRSSVTGVDPDGVVVDATDGWTVWTLSGEDAPHAFARLSAVALPDEGWIQGRVAGVPAKAIVDPGAIHVLVAAMWSDHVRSLVRAICSDLGLHEGDAPRPWSSRPHEETATR